LVAGTNWVSTGNGDMTVYVLGADHLYEHGFYQVPQQQELNREVDRTWDASFVYSMGEVRFASQLALASLMALSGLEGVQCFMMLIVALHCIAIMAAAALVCTKRSRATLSLVVFLVIASSANLILGTLDQLIAQDFGLAALSGSALALEVPPSGSASYARACLCSLFVAALFLAYPELSPFLVLSFFTFITIVLCRDASQWRRYAAYFGSLAVVALLFINANLPGALHLILVASTQGGHTVGENALFPYFLTPLGFPIGWGFIAYGGGDAASPQVQFATIVGALLFVAALVAASRLAWRLEPAAIVACSMLLLFFYLFFTQNGFGLFKLAMYAQPFVLASLTIAISGLLPTLSRARRSEFP